MGSVVSGRELKELIARVISGAPSLDLQLGENGIDLTLMEIERFSGVGSIDLDNSERVVPEGSGLEFDGDGWIWLEMGAYKIRFNEIVRIPKDMVALTLPRSSLLRCGVTLECAVWDAGYEGRGEALLVVHNPAGIRIRRNARMAQMIFIRCSERVKGYSGVYQGVV